MIVFDLTCAHGHRFEGWFASADDFEQQSKAVLVRCPVCDDASVVRLPSAKVHVGRATQDAPRASEEPDAEATIAGLPDDLVQLRRSCAPKRRATLPGGSPQDPLRGSPGADPRPGVEGRGPTAAREGIDFTPAAAVPDARPSPIVPARRVEDLCGFGYNGAFGPLARDGRAADF